MQRIKNILSAIFLALACLASAQFSNDWINYDQQYYKIKVVEDGLYRITSEELSAAGVPVGSILVDRFQLFYKGEEVAVRAVNNGNNRIDYLEFYGQRNDGTSDTELYKVPEAQPHALHNLFTDSSSYFLTWKLLSGSGKRMTLSSDQNTTGLTAQPFHQQNDLRLESSSYKTGLRYGLSNDILTAEYDYGEGWAGNDIAKNGSATYTFTLTNSDQSVQKPSLELILFGRNNLEHLVDISVGPNASSLRSIGQVSFEEQTTTSFSSEIEWTDVDASGTLIVKVTTVGLAGQADRIAVGYVRLFYPQDPIFDNADLQSLYTFPTSAQTRGYGVIPATGVNSIRVFDISDPANPIRISVITAFSDRVEFVYPNASQQRDFLVVNQPKSVGSISEVEMTEWEFSNKDFLILTHPALDSLVDGVNPVSEYLQYRESAQGGSHSVLRMHIEDVFNQFGYGDPSPVAIRNMVTKALLDGDAEFLFIIGKGTTANLDYYRKDPESLIHFVPTFGVPGSDGLFSVNVLGDNLAPALPTGRLSAYNASDVKAYLDKVKEMETLEYDALWRKDLVQLSGGLTQGERSSFANHINTFKVKAENEFLGGRSFNINKETNDEIQLINITDQVNDGVSLITFFGHSTGQLNDIEIGRVSPGFNNFGYSNQGKYPIFLVNGCNAGEIFISSDGTPAQLTLGEDWLLTPNLGGVGFIANTDLALSSNLKRYSDLFFTIAFNQIENFGKPVGQIMQLVGENYFVAFGEEELDKAQVYQTVFQGDPSLKVFGAENPDYEVNSSEMSAVGINQKQVLATSDSFQIKFVVKNYGRVAVDSFDVQVVRTLGNGDQETYLKSFNRVLRLDTLSFSIPNNPQNVNEGMNSFVLTVDPENEQEELKETNNSGTFEVFIPKGNTINLLPIDFGTVDENQLELIWQSANTLEGERTYELEIDSTMSFDSPFLNSQLLNGKGVLTYSQDFSNLSDSTTIYWRTRYSEPLENEDTSWVTSSFSIIPTGSGWAQIGRSQLSAANRSDVTFDQESKQWAFRETVTDVEIRNHGVSSANEYTDNLVLIDGFNYLATNNTLDPDCKRKNAINAILFGRENAGPYSPLQRDDQPDVFNDLICGTRPQIINNFNETNVLGPDRYLDSLISIMENGDMILLFSFDSVAFSNWDAQLLSSLNKVGIADASITSLVDGQPVIFLGRKGDSPGSAIEVTDDGSGTPIKEQAIQLINEVTGRFTSGRILSPRIGPAISWNQFNYEIESDANDSYLFNVLGVTESGAQEIVFTDSRTDQFDISNVDANQYPYLQLALELFDETDLTPPQLKSWGLDYVLPPEGVLLSTDEPIEELPEGLDFEKTFYFRSISETEFEDSLIVDYTVSNIQSGNVFSDQFKIGFSDNDSIAFTPTVDTRGKVGENNIVVRVAASEQELYLSNNLLNLVSVFNVIEDQTNPVLDVTFDGQYILTGDIVSPNPTISIRFKDENEYLYKQDTSGILVEMKSPCDGCGFERIEFSDPKLSYTIASEEQDFDITYLPGPLEDGVYTLRVQGQDETGNESGRYPYEVSFEVINESSITHFYPYPNPFSTSTRFVFTLTGSNIPDQIKIQIMTVSGRVVREITQDEIGPLKVGNNITQYAWDGRDEFGDQLANGVYLYKVFIKQAGEDINHRNTIADRAFKNGFGKLYILR